MVAKKISLTKKVAVRKPKKAIAKPAQRKKTAPRKRKPTMFRFASSMPLNAEGVIVQYNPNWRITAILPPATKTLTHYEGTSAFDIPRMLAIHTFAPNLLTAKTYYKKPMEGHAFRLLVCKPDPEQKEKLLALPWAWGSNVGANGTVCWGENAYIKDMRRALNLFWTSMFGWNPTYEKFGEVSSSRPGHVLRDVKPYILGTDYIVAETRPSIVIISSDPKDLDLAPDDVINGAATPGDDLVHYYHGGYGANDGRREPADLELVDGSGRLPITGAVPGKMIILFGKSIEGTKYEIETKSGKLYWESEKQVLIKA